MAEDETSFAGDSDREKGGVLRMRGGARARAEVVGQVRLDGGGTPHQIHPHDTHMRSQEIDEEKHEREEPDVNPARVMSTNRKGGLRTSRGTDGEDRNGTPVGTRQTAWLGSSPHARGGLVSTRAPAEERVEERRAPEVVGHPGGSHMPLRAQEKHRDSSEVHSTVISHACGASDGRRSDARSLQWVDRGGRVATPRKKDRWALLERSEPVRVGMRSTGEREDRQEDTPSVTGERLGRDRPVRGILRRGEVDAGRIRAVADSESVHGGVHGTGRAGVVSAGRTITSRGRKASRPPVLPTITEEEAPAPTPNKDIFGTEFGKAFYPLLEHTLRCYGVTDTHTKKHEKSKMMKHLGQVAAIKDITESQLESVLLLLRLLLTCEDNPDIQKLHMSAARLLTPLIDSPPHRDEAISEIIGAVFNGKITDTVARKYMNQLSIAASDGGTAVAASIAEAASRYGALQPKDERMRLRELINEHIVRGGMALRKLGVHQDTWRDVLDKITKDDRNACYTNEHGTLEWTDTEEARIGIGNATVVTWNANGLRKAVRTGALARFLDANTDADIIHINEAKCSPTSLPKVWEFRAAMAARGYRHVYWNWCSIPGRHGDWGCMVLSKLKPQSVRFGMGQDHIDAEGRMITLRFNDATLVNAYVPCISLKGDVTDRRSDFVKELIQHVSDEQDQCQTRGLSRQSVYLQGDFNVAATAIDSNLSVEKQKSQASATDEERELHLRMMALGKLEDCYRVMHGPPNASTRGAARA